MVLIGDEVQTWSREEGVMLDAQPLPGPPDENWPGLSMAADDTVFCVSRAGGYLELHEAGEMGFRPGAAKVVGELVVSFNSDEKRTGASGSVSLTPASLAMKANDSARAEASFDRVLHLLASQNGASALEVWRRCDKADDLFNEYEAIRRGLKAMHGARHWTWRFAELAMEKKADLSEAMRDYVQADGVDERRRTEIMERLCSVVPKLEDAEFVTLLVKAFSASTAALGQRLIESARERRVISEHAFLWGCGVAALEHPQLALDLLERHTKESDHVSMRVLASMVKADALARLGQRSKAVDVMTNLGTADARFQRREALGDLSVFVLAKDSLLEVHRQVVWDGVPGGVQSWVRPIRFAAITSGLENFSSYGEETMRGVNIGLEAARRSYGYTMDHWFGPEQADAAETERTMDHVIRTIRPDAVFWFGLTEDTSAVMPIVEKAGIPLWNCAGERLTQSALEFAIQPERAFQGQVMARFASRHQGAKRAAVVSPYLSPKTDAMDAAFRQEFQRLGGMMTGEALKFERGEEAFTSILQSLREQSPDVVFMSGYYEEAGRFLRQLRAAGLTMPVLGWEGWDSPRLRELAGPEGIANSFMATPFASDDPDPKLQAFIRAYIKAHRQLPGAFAAFACDTAMLLANAIERAGSARKEDILRAIRSTVNFEGVTGTLSFDREGKVIREGVVVEVLPKGTRFTTRVAP